MVYNFNGKKLRIDESELEKISKTLDLTKDEAIAVWLDDNGYTDNEEQIALDNKASAVKINHHAKAINTKPKEKKPKNYKEDFEKISIINNIYAFLSGKGYENVKIENKAKIIENKYNFKIDKNCYLLDDYTKNLTEWEQGGGTGIKRLTHCADNSRKLWKGLAIKNLAKLGLVVA